MYNLPTLLPEMLPTRVSLSFRSHNNDLTLEKGLEILDTALACLPLDSLVMVDAHGLINSWDASHFLTQHFSCHLSPKWPLLQCVCCVHLVPSPTWT